MGIRKAFVSPPLGLGKVTVRLSRSIQEVGMQHSLSRHPVAKLISKATPIQEGLFISAIRHFWISSSVSSGRILFADCWHL